MPYSGIIHGTEGATEVTLTVENALDATLTCEASLAHWYSQSLDQVAPGGALQVSLWHDPETGVLNLMNATDDRMPVEAIWCGAAPNFSATRGRLSLPIQKDALPFTGISYVCTMAGDAPRTTCDMATD